MKPRPSRSINPLVDSALAGDRLSLARLLSKIENRDAALPAIIERLYPHTGRAHVIGVTGPPGAGKSTLVDQLTVSLRASGSRVGIVAVDPSSPFSGGAILGDRIRMQRHASDAGVYIRSLGTRGQRGGLSHATKEVVLALDAVGFGVVIVETAGVGQTELEILRLAQSVLVVLVPESGDSIQVMKAGLMEIADLFAVNKCDRPGSDQLVRELVAMVAMSPRAEGDWTPPVHKTEATKGVGVNDLAQSLARHFAYLRSTGKLIGRQREFLRHELEDIIIERAQAKLARQLASSKGLKIIEKLSARRLDPYRAANLLIPDKKDLN